MHMRSGGPAAAVFFHFSMIFRRDLRDGGKLSKNSASLMLRALPVRKGEDFARRNTCRPRPFGGAQMPRHHERRERRRAARRSSGLSARPLHPSGLLVWRRAEVETRARLRRFCGCLGGVVEMGRCSGAGVCRGTAHACGTSWFMLSLRLAPPLRGLSFTGSRRPAARWRR